MVWLVLWLVGPSLLLLLLLLYIVWKNVADADLTLLWKEQFGLKPGEMFSVLRHHKRQRRRRHILNMNLACQSYVLSAIVGEKV